MGVFLVVSVCLVWAFGLGALAPGGITLTNDTMGGREDALGPVLAGTPWGFPPSVLPASRPWSDHELCFTRGESAA